MSHVKSQSTRFMPPRSVLNCRVKPAFTQRGKIKDTFDGSIVKHKVVSVEEIAPVRAAASFRFAVSAHSLENN
ncbi:hypothetical protein EVAR_75420_1 [Eumeta japonica]|uniref:Uncharacterized protein n=1 Tax=Eumeta variegata TaxID=151549 RepID=A0A4C1TMY8_EUMVA|nr:hypothetical protein EVAR_75420_1 [Eumeta japonica]